MNIPRMLRNPLDHPEFIVPMVLIPFFIWAFLFATPQAIETEEFWTKEIKQASCGELKDWILNKEVPMVRGMDDLAVHEFTWRCEK